MGETSREEEVQLSAWLADNPQNRAYLDELRRIWETSQQAATQSTIDEDMAWQRFRVKLHHPARETETGKKRSFSWQRMAAALVILIGLSIGGYWVMKTNTGEQSILVQSGELVKGDTLKNGSIITLNKHSEIKYPDRFGKKKRTVSLSGEAFFQVAADKERPFIIKAGEVEVTVVGTSFNVHTNPQYTEIIVETGIVRVLHKGKMAELKANERAYIRTTDSVIVKESVNDRLYNYYRTKEFVCDDTPLWKLVEVVNEAYQAKIVIGRDELRNLRLTTSFNNESLEQVLEIIRLTFNLRITRNGDQVILQ